MVLVELAVKLFMLGIFTWVMARDMRRRPGAGYFHAVMRGFVPVAIVSLALFAGMQDVSDPQFAEYRKGFVENYSRALLTYGDKGLGADEAKNLAEIVFRLQPGLQCLFWLTLLTAVAFVLRRVLARRGQTGYPPPLSRFKAPDGLIWLLLLPGALVLMGDRGWLGEVEPWLRDLALNVLVVMLAIYLFQGMMVMVERLSRLGLPKPLGALLVLLALMLAALPGGKGPAAALLLLGLFDTWFDLRHLNPKAKDDERRSS